MLYTKTPPDLSVVTERLCYIKFYNTQLKRFNFLATSYKKDYIDEIGLCFVINGKIIDKDQKINLLENAHQQIYSIQIANKSSWQIEEEFLKYNIIYSLELDKENNVTIIFSNKTGPIINHNPKIILR